MKTLLAAALTIVPLLSMAQEGPSVTPYRPSVSSPAQLPTAGQLELELGGLRSSAEQGRRHSLPYTLKLGFTPQWGVLISGESVVSAPDGNGSRTRGFGDTLFVLKRAFLIDEESALGLEFGAKAPTARTPIGSGRADYSVNGIYSQDLGSMHMDANLNASRLGATEADAGRIQTGYSASFSRPLSEQWGVTGEWSGTRRRGADSTAQWLLAFSYSPNKRLTFDVGLAHGLRPASPNWASFAGVVLPLTQLW